MTDRQPGPADLPRAGQAPPGGTAPSEPTAAEAASAPFRTGPPTGPIRTGAPPAAASDRIQALLNRAVEDQLAEQRSMQGALGELHASLQRLQADVAQLVADDRVERVSGDISGLSANMRAVTGNLAARLDEVGRVVDGMPQALTDRLAVAVRQGLTDQLGSVGSALDELREQGAGSVQALVGTVTERLTALSEQTTELQKEVGQSRGAAAELDERLTDRLDRLLAAELAELRGDLADLTAATQVYQEAQEARQVRLEGAQLGREEEARRRDGAAPGPDAVAEQLRAGVREDMTALAQTVAGLPAAVTSLRERVDGVSERVQGLAGLPAALTQLDGRLGPVEERLAALESLPRLLADLADRMEQLGPALATSLGRVVADQVGDRVEELEDGIDARLGRLELVLAPVAGLAGLETRVATLSGRVEPAAALVPELSRRVEELLSRPEPEPGVLAAQERLANRVLTLESQLTAVGERLEAQVARQLGRGLDERLEGRLAGLHESVEALAEVPMLVAAVPALGEALLTVGERLDRLDRLAEVPGRLEDLAGVGSDVARVREDVRQALARAAAEAAERARDQSVALSAQSERDREEAAARQAEAARAAEQQRSGLLEVVQTELASVHGEIDGVRADLRLVAEQQPALVTGAVDAALAGPVAARLAAATTDSEQRLVAHVDEAVLALAEALLRRRVVRRPYPGLGTPGGGAPPPATSVLAADGEVSPAETEAEAETGLADVGPEASDLAQVGPELADVEPETEPEPEAEPEDLVDESEDGVDEKVAAPTGTAPESPDEAASDASLDGHDAAPGASRLQGAEAVSDDDIDADPAAAEVPASGGDGAGGDGAGGGGDVDPSQGTEAEPGAQTSGPFGHVLGEDEKGWPRPLHPEQAADAAGADRPATPAGRGEERGFPAPPRSAPAPVAGQEPRRRFRFRRDR